MIEYKDYDLVFGKQAEDWGCKIKTGEFVDTIIQFKDIAINEDNDGSLAFDFLVSSSPNPNANVDNQDLVEVASMILNDVLHNCVDEGSAEFTDKETGEKIDVDQVFK